MFHDDSGKSDLSIAGLLPGLIAAITAIGLLLMASDGIEQPKQTAKVFVPAALSQATAPNEQ